MSLTPAAPTLETRRLVLRGWHEGDLDGYAKMLADPVTARFITRGGRAYDQRQSWSEAAFLIGHWQLRGYGMFVVEERASGNFVGRVGPLQPKGWPDFEIAWAIAADSTGKGYASEAAEAAIDWSFSSFQLDRIISIIHSQNLASQRVAERLGERRTSERFSPLGEACEVWETDRRTWQARRGHA